MGETIRGVLFDALPVGRRDLSAGTKTLVFESGWGLTIAPNGSFWTESPDDITRAIAERREALGETERDIRDVLRLAGESV